MNALRLIEGFEPREFEQRTGLALRGTCGRAWRAPARAGCSNAAGGRWRASARGFDLLNELLIEFPADRVGRGLTRAPYST